MKKKHQHSKPNGISNDKLSAKKAAILASGKKSRLPLLVAAVLVVGIVAAYAGYYTVNRTPSGRTATAATVTEQQTAVTFPVSHFEDGKAQHFDYQTAEGVTVRYFVLKSSDGVIRAAFDACDVCWPAGKGYYQEGDNMVCRNCGRRFASILVNEVKGGCNPAPLERSIQGDQVVINIEDIGKGKSYFNFSGKA